MLFFPLINVDIYEQEKFHVQLRWARKKFYNLGGQESKLVATSVVPLDMKNMDVYPDTLKTADCEDEQADWSLSC